MNLTLPTNDKGYTLDIYKRPVHFKNNPYLAGTNTKLELTNEHISEIYKCSEDVFYFIENYCKIFTLDDGWQLPKLRSYQRNLIQHYVDNSFSNVLSGRQTGKSTSTIMYCLWLIIFKADTIVGFAANKWSMVKENLDRLRAYYEYLPMWLKHGIKSWNKTYIELDNGSKVYTSTSTDSAFRGFGISVLFVDEVAFVKKWDDFSSSVFPTVSSAKSPKVIYTSTPKGLNHWYVMWQEAEAGRSMFKNFKVDWWEVEGRDEDWRNTMIGTLPGGEQEFLQEWAAEFMGSSKTLIDTYSLKKLKYIDYITSNDYIDSLKIYKEPVEGNQYIITVDGAKQGKDKTSIQVINISRFPFEQVAVVNSKINHVVAAPSIDRLGKYYNTAFIIAENNEGAGTFIADTLYHAYDYENLFKVPDKKNFGFHTNRKTRPSILNFLKLFIEKDKLIINDKLTIEQLFTFIEKNGKYQADDGKFDDLVMSLALVFAAFLDLNAFDDYDKFLDAINTDIIESEDNSTSEVISIGYFDDGVEEETNFMKEGIYEYNMDYRYDIHSAFGEEPDF